MKYEMPALSDEERKEIIEYITASHENICVIKSLSDMLRLRKLRNKIALAALTAEVRGSLIQSVNPQSGNVAIFYRERGINSISPEEIAEWEMSEIDQLYTAPPVPVINDRLEWLESMHTLHYSVSILYVVDGYQIQQCRYGEEIGDPIHGETLNDAIDLAMAAGWNTNRTPS